MFKVDPHSVLSPKINYNSDIYLFYLVNLHIKLAFWNMQVCWKVVVKDNTSSLQAIWWKVTTHYWMALACWIIGTSTFKGTKAWG